MYSVTVQSWRLGLPWELEDKDPLVGPSPTEGRGAVTVATMADHLESPPLVPIWGTFCGRGLGSWRTKCNGLSQTFATILLISFF